MANAEMLFVAVMADYGSSTKREQRRQETREGAELARAGFGSVVCFSNDGAAADPDHALCLLQPSEKETPPAIVPYGLPKKLQPIIARSGQPGRSA